MQLTITAVLATLALTVTALPNPVEKRYAPGQCGVHVQQYQKNEGPGSDTSQYRLTIQLKDAAGAGIGGVSLAQAPNGVGVDVDSALPYVLVVTAEGVDSDPITFSYGAQNWNSGSGQCSVGGYDSGSRQMDCFFPC